MDSVAYHVLCISEGISPPDFLAAESCRRQDKRYKTKSEACEGMKFLFYLLWVDIVDSCHVKIYIKVFKDHRF